jgi:hypothetical protein
MHRGAGVDLHTIQRWLRHSKLERTVQYLADSEDQSAVIRPLRMRPVLSTLVKRKGNPVAPPASEKTLRDRPQNLRLRLKAKNLSLRMAKDIASFTFIDFAHF